MNIKPRIRYIKPYFYGIECKPVFVCESKESIQIGDTKEKAYENWLNDMPKNTFGRLFRRIVNSIL